MGVKNPRTGTKGVQAFTASCPVTSILWKDHTHSDQGRAKPDICLHKLCGKPPRCQRGKPGSSPGGGV